MTDKHCTCDIRGYGCTPTGIGSIGGLFEEIAKVLSPDFLEEMKDDHIPDVLAVDHVIFNPPATIVYWQDGDKTVARCNNDEFSEEFGFAMACMRRIYGSRRKFKAQFEDAYRPYLAKKKEKRKPKQSEGAALL